MKVFGTIAKIVAALAAVVGAIYMVATYGDEIVAWSKKILGTCKGYYEEARDKFAPCSFDKEADDFEDICPDAAACEEAVEEAAEEVTAAAEEAVAAESDFEA